MVIFWIFVVKFYEVYFKPDAPSWQSQLKRFSVNITATTNKKEKGQIELTTSRSKPITERASQLDTLAISPELIALANQQTRGGSMNPNAHLRIKRASISRKASLVHFDLVSEGFDDPHLVLFCTTEEETQESGNLKSSFFFHKNLDLRYLDLIFSIFFKLA